MVRYLIKRILLGITVLFAVSVLSFLMFFALPRDPVTGMCPKNCNAERLERVRTEHTQTLRAIEDLATKLRERTNQYHRELERIGRLYTDLLSKARLAFRLGVYLRPAPLLT